MARPRVLDINKAIETATNLFWQNGYERTSLADLTEAMGITPPSFYFAFHSKLGLFKRVLDLYRSTQMAYTEEALQKPTARSAVEHLLYRKADAQTDPAHPPGCLAVNCSLSCSECDASPRHELAAMREINYATLRARFEKARACGDLPAASDPDELARFVQVIGWGMAIAAQSGATRDDLYRTVARALQAWPS
jgi:AcrR family transcriptional regulator